MNPTSVATIRFTNVHSAKKKKGGAPAVRRTEGYRMALYDSADTAAAGTSDSTLATTYEMTR